MRKETTVPARREVGDREKNGLLSRRGKKGMAPTGRGKSTNEPRQGGNLESMGKEKRIYGTSRGREEGRGRRNYCERTTGEKGSLFLFQGRRCEEERGTTDHFEEERVKKKKSAKTHH